MWTHSKYGYDALGNRLRITLVRTAYYPDADSDSGTHHIRYALVPHPGSWQDADIPRRGLEFNQPLVVGSSSDGAVGSHTPVRPLRSGLATVILAGKKRACDTNGVVVRLYESGGRAGNVRLSGVPAGWSAREVSIVEDPVGPLLVEHGEVELAFSACQVRSVLLES